MVAVGPLHGPVAPPLLSAGRASTLDTTRRRGLPRPPPARATRCLPPACRDRGRVRPGSSARVRGRGCVAGGLLGGPTGRGAQHPRGGRGGGLVVRGAAP